MSGEIIRLDDHRKSGMEGDPELMVQISIYDDGSGTLWLSDFIDTAEQFNWSVAKVSEVVANLLHEKSMRAGKL